MTSHKKTQNVVGKYIKIKDGPYARVMFARKWDTGHVVLAVRTYDTQKQSWNRDQINIQPDRIFRVLSGPPLATNNADLPKRAPGPKPKTPRPQRDPLLARLIKVYGAPLTAC